MAKKNKSQDNNNERSKGSKILAAVFGLLIVIVWLAIFAVLIKIDFGGFGSSILRPLLKDVPVINKILPNVSDEQIAYENDYPYKTLEEAIARIKELELENEGLLTGNSSDSDRIMELETELERLKVFEDNQLQFEERVLEFEKNIVFADQAPDIKEYKAYYESINPTNAEEIYRQVVEQAQASEALQKKADIYKKMKPAAAAPILEGMTADIDLVAQMLLYMKPNESALILAEMNSTMAAKITKKMFDMDQTN